MPAEIYSLSAAAATGKKVPWSPEGPAHKPAIEVGSVWVCKDDRDECTVQGVIRSPTGRIKKVYYLIKSDGEIGEWTEALFRKHWCEKNEFLRIANEAACRLVKLRPIVTPPVLQKGWQVWRENESGEFYVITETRNDKDHTIHSFFKGALQGEMSATVLEEQFTWIFTR